MRTPHRFLAGFLLTLTLSIGASSAFGWRPALPTLQRESDASGRTYVLIDMSKRFRILRRDEGLPSVTAAVAWNSDEASALEPALGDAVLAQGELPTLPPDLFVRPDGAGLAALGNRFSRTSDGTRLVVVDRDGEVTAELTRAELFGVSPDARRPEAQEWFPSGAWLTRDGGTLVVVGLRLSVDAVDSFSIRRTIRLVDLDSADVSGGTLAAVARGLARTDERARRAAVDAVRFLGGDEVSKALRELRDDDAAPLGLRARASLELARFGDDATPDLARRALALPRPDGVAQEDRRALIEGLPHLLGDDAAPVLRDLLGTRDEADWYSAQTGLLLLGDATIPSLIDIVRGDERARARRAAARTLGTLRDADALGALLGVAAHDSNRIVVSEALRAAYRVAGADLGPYLPGLLRAGTAADWQIIALLERVKSPETVSLLIDRLRSETKRPVPIIAALKFQTCQDLGEDADDWQRWWDSEQR